MSVTIKEEAIAGGALDSRKLSQSSDPLRKYKGIPISIFIRMQEMVVVLFEFSSNGYIDL